jgi:hypothetical protein
LVTYFLLLKKSNWLEGIQVKNHQGWQYAKHMLLTQNSYPTLQQINVHLI